jgi:hypothetical protein
MGPVRTGTDNMFHFTVQVKLIVKKEQLHGASALVEP